MSKERAETHPEEESKEWQADYERAAQRDGGNDGSRGFFFFFEEREGGREEVRKGQTGRKKGPWRESSSS